MNISQTPLYRRRKRLNQLVMLLCQLATVIGFVFLFAILFTLVTSREPTVAEREACMSLFGKLKGRYTDNDKDAQAFLSVGDSPRDKKLNAAEHAAWAQVSLTVLASDVALRVY